MCVIVLIDFVIIGYLSHHYSSNPSPDEGRDKLFMLGGNADYVFGFSHDFQSI